MRTSNYTESTSLLVFIIAIIIHFKGVILEYSLVGTMLTVAVIEHVSPEANGTLLEPA